MQDLDAEPEQRCYDVIVLSQPCYDLFDGMFQQNKYKKDGKLLELICICVPQLRPYL